MSFLNCQIYCMKNSDLLKARHSHAWQSIPLCILLFVFFLPAALFAQDITLKGKVLDKNNEPVIGATVKIVGTPRGTTTTPDGSFTLSVPASAQLTVSAIGFLPQTVSV